MNDFREKIVTTAQALDLQSFLKAKGKTTAWTNGCFDLFHYGHLYYLWECSKLGDILIIGINSDASVQKIKGPRRPINNEKERSQLVAALSFVDYVIIFDSPSPVETIKQLCPDIYIKGGDYNINTINQVERGVVEEYGGKIAFVPFIPGFSTTRLIEKIVEIYRDNP